MRIDRNKQGGFTLIELSVVLIIFGLIMSVFVTLIKNYGFEQVDAHNELSFSVSKSALLSYNADRGFYPCPADPRLGRNDPNYGREQRVGLNCVATGGIQQVTAVGVDRNQDGNNDTVLIGAVPFVTLLDPDNNPLTNDGVPSEIPLNESATYDGWGRKITYAVTTNLTRAATYNAAFGAIDIVDENDRTLVTPAATTHFTLISHGEDGRGGYTNEGVLVQACPPTLPLPPLGATATAVSELENCDPDNKFLSGLRNDQNHSYNDDLTKFTITQNTGLWTYVDGMADAIQNTNSGNVGIGTNTPFERLEIAGNLRAQSVRANTYCEGITNTRTGVNCLPANVVGGNLAAMTCPAGQMVVSIEKNKVNCAPIFNGPPPATTCPTGCAATGFERNTAGVTNLICKDTNTKAPC